MLNKEERLIQQNEMASKLWNKSIIDITNKELQTLIQMMFYQTFLIEVHEMKFTLETTEYGCEVSFLIKGEAFTSTDTLEKNELEEEEIENEAGLEE